MAKKTKGKGTDPSAASSVAASPVALTEEQIKILAQGGARAEALSKELPFLNTKTKRSGKKSTKKASPVDISAEEMKNIQAKAKISTAVKKRIEGE